MQELRSILQLLEGLSAALVLAGTCWRSSSTLGVVMLLTWRLPYQLLSAMARCTLPAVPSTFQGKAEFYVLSHIEMTLLAWSNIKTSPSAKEYYLWRQLCDLEH